MNTLDAAMKWHSGRYYERDRGRSRYAKFDSYELKHFQEPGWRVLAKSEWLKARWTINSHCNSQSNGF